VTDETTQPDEITEDELDDQSGEPLPDREAMSIISLERPLPLDSPDLSPPPLAE
jgi:hypothetical protein